MKIICALENPVMCRFALLSVVRSHFLVCIVLLSLAYDLSTLKIQYKYLVNNKQLIAAFKQKICLCLTEHLFWLVFNFLNNA